MDQDAVGEIANSTLKSIFLNKTYESFIKYFIEMR